ncbi:MAG: UvrD-helicase domain-containing protein [Candidatus Nanohaloarchaea archaeon]
MRPNSEQRELIQNTEGVYLVDAGAGTGKTFAMTRRYVKIVEEEGRDPEDVFLATFTRNAAEEMSERIVELSDISPGRIFDAPISTFHSYCQEILERRGFDAPDCLGFDGRITEETDVIESEVRERQEFRDFYGEFRSENPRYDDFYRICSPDNLLELLKSLASKGIVPQKDGWYGKSESYLEGDYDSFKELFREKNKPRKTQRGKKQSELRERLYSYRWKDFEPDAPEAEEVRGGRGTKSVRRDFMEKSFHEDREGLKDFLHDLYTGYLSYCLSRNFLNFPFVLCLTYVLLVERRDVREQESFSHVMIDEFQDTNEIQFKLALLLSDRPNIAAVGDWKQSIYSFQHASVDNILEFEERLEKYLGELERSGKKLDIDGINRINLTRNYRSSQQILDFSEKALELPATRHENVSAPEITPLESETDFEQSEIGAIISDQEAEAVVAKVQEMVENAEYRSPDGEKLDYGDVAVLTRTRSLGLDIQDVARSYGVPADYEGGIELFKTPQAVLLLAWLRIVESGSRRGWAVVLERAGYSINEAKKIMKTDSFPPDMDEFRQDLENTENLTGLARKVFDRYGYRDRFSDRIVEVMEETYRSGFMNRAGMIGFMEDNIEEGETYEVEKAEKDSSLTVQTIHAAKGLEYPVVLIAGVNSSIFPSQTSSGGSIEFQGVAGIRQQKVYSEGHSFTFDSWRNEILSKCFSGEYDEERRLMYVAMTRAEKYLFFSAEEGSESRFFEELGLQPEQVSSAPDQGSESFEGRPDLELEGD